jgi:hypothetical protein
MKRYHHFGLVAPDDETPLEGEIFFESTGLGINNPLKHPQGIEWLRYSPGNTADQRLKTEPHIAWEVDDLEAHIDGKTIYRPVGEMGDPPFARSAWTEEDGIITEYIQYTHPTRRWFDDPA